MGVYIFLVISIPMGAYLASQYQTYKSSATEVNTKIPKKISSLPLPDATKSASASPTKELLSLSESNPSTPGESEPTPGVDSNPTIATSFGPTLSLKVALEGRPKDNQATKLFVGIVEGDLSANPKFLLSFNVNTAKDGTYSNLSLAGLNSGTKYTALLKGSAQIATASAFIMSLTVSNLNDGQEVNLLTGDLNEDNVINLSDYNIVLKVLGTKNEMADFNKDGIINLFDIAIISKNLGQVGASGAWTSPIPKVASPSGSLATTPGVSFGSPGVSSQGGYWIWVPK